MLINELTGLMLDVLKHKVHQYKTVKDYIKIFCFNVDAVYTAGLHTEKKSELSPQ